MNRDSTSQAALPRPATARGERTRQKLVDAAETVFGQKGYEAASIADITQEAGVALGTFYVYFPDKKALFIECVDNLGHRLRRDLAKAIDGLDDRLSIEEVGLAAFLEFVRRHRLLYRIVRQAEFVDVDCFRRYYDRIAEPYAKGLKAAMAKGQVRDLDPEALAYCLMGLADFLGMRFVLWGRGRASDDVLATAREFIRNGLAVQRRKP